MVCKLRVLSFKIVPARLRLRWSRSGGRPDTTASLGGDIAAHVHDASVHVRARSRSARPIGRSLGQGSNSIQQSPPSIKTIPGGRCSPFCRYTRYIACGHGDVPRLSEAAPSATTPARPIHGPPAEKDISQPCCDLELYDTGPLSTCSPMLSTAALNKSCCTRAQVDSVENCFISRQSHH